MNSGSITTNAKDDLLARLRKTNYGDNVFFLDGERLETIRRWGISKNQLNINEKITGLANQLALNILIWKKIRQNIGTHQFDGRRAILRAIEEYVTAPFFPDRLSAGDMLMHWQEAAIIESIETRFQTVVLNAESKKQDEITLQGVIDRATTRAASFIQTLRKLQSELATF